MRKVLFALAILFVFSSLALAATLRIYFLDVGQGDASVIIASTGEVVLIDSGPNEDVILNHLKKLGISHIDLVIASHPHADHITGMDTIIDIYKPRAYMDPGIPHTTRTYERVLEAIERNNVKYYYATERRIKLGPMILSVLPPGSFGDLNNDSAVIRLDFGQFSCLFTGDIEKEREAELIRVAKDKLDVDVLKVPHHGSSTGTTIALLKATTPKIAIISCGKGNPYGHPHSETLEVLQNTGVTVYRTDINGTILIKTDGNEYEVVLEEGEPRGPPVEQFLQTPKPTPKPTEFLYAASKKSDVFHHIWCGYVARIKPANLILFRSREEAIRSGRRPCKVCNP